MAYFIDKTDPSADPIQISGDTVDTTSTSLTLFGRGKLRWGEEMDENLVHLLENFASEKDSGSPVAPDSALVPNPIDGQLWYEKSEKKLYIYDEQSSPAQWRLVAEVAASAAVTGGSPLIIGNISPAGLITPWGGPAPAADATSRWIACDGASHSTGLYPDLFANIGYTYGGGGASFDVPDMQGNVPVGEDGGTFAGLGSTVGDEDSALAITNMPAHDHGGAIVSTSTGSHNHSGSTAISAGSHNHSGSTSNTVSDHDHGISFSDIESGGGETGTETWDGGAEGVTGPDGSHSHSLNITSDGSHTHTLSISTEPNHSHTVTVPSQGSGTSFTNIQPSLVVNYIIKTTND